MVDYPVCLQDSLLGDVTAESVLLFILESSKVFALFMQGTVAFDRYGDKLVVGGRTQER